MMDDVKMAREYIKGKVLFVAKKDKSGLALSSLRDAHEHTSDWADWSILTLANDGFVIGEFNALGEYYSYYLCDHKRGAFDAFCKRGIDLIANDVRPELWSEPK